MQLVQEPASGGGQAPSPTNSGTNSETNNETNNKTSPETNNATTSAAAHAPLVIQVADLSEGAQFFIWCLRHWTQALRLRQPPEAVLRPAHDGIGAPGAAELLDESLCLLAVSASNRIFVRSPAQASLHEHEALLLKAFRQLQLGRREQAAEVLAELLQDKLVPTFVRTASRYTRLLTDANMALNAASRLKLVTEEPPR